MKPTVMSRRFEYLEWEYADKGVPWRTGGKQLEDFEKLERAGYQIFLTHATGIVLRRPI